MIIAVCDPKGIAIEAIKTILYHDKGLSDRISRIYEFWNIVHEKMEMAAVSVMKKRLTFKSCFSRSALRFVSRTRASIFRWNFSEGWKSSFISSKLGICASSRSCASVTIIAIRASGEIRILSSFITIFLQSGQNDFTRSVQTNFYISGRNVEKIGNLADLVALNF